MLCVTIEQDKLAKTEPHPNKKRFKITPLEMYSALFPYIFLNIPQTFPIQQNFFFKQPQAKPALIELQQETLFKCPELMLVSLPSINVSYENTRHHSYK